MDTGWGRAGFQGGRGVEIRRHTCWGFTRWGLRGEMEKGTRDKESRFEAGSRKNGNGWYVV